ncbi:cell division protein FtsZ [Ekhidna lutea]|uniref:Cell division protein FtsZ n=1 Tax=Ekhidna lutea TaxID=447679 RepID=A0A239L120_EKHLU|nr:cell division protein FtsZ [Ekhidna lutea]SNT24256.1 cell division protein FtsZ [Ekhidna lutea]
MAENMYQFDLPSHHKSIIKVVGVGGGGSNAVNHMYSLGIRDVEFVVCNTDHQALESSAVPNRLQIGTNLTSGLGAGANPERGKNAAIESKEEIRDLLSQDTKMVFITAGMGGGTGTGAAPVIAQVASELDILTVGIVTAPFAFEGKKKMKAAEDGIKELKKYCDTVLVIMNDKLREIYGNLSISEAFGQADNVLTTAAKGIAEIITVPGYVNVDFEDVKTVMKGAGPAVMGSAKTIGDNRARRAAEEALNSPLLNQQDIYGAEKILLSIISGDEAELQMDELTDITDYIQEYAGDNAEVIFGHGVDSSLGENISVTVIATGFGKVDEDGEYISKEEEAKRFDLLSQKEIDESKKKGNTSDFMFELEDDTDKDGVEDWDYEFSSLKDEIKREVEEEDQRSKRPAKQSSFEFDFTNGFDNDEDEEVNEDEVNISDAFEASPSSKQVRLAQERAEREAMFNDKKFDMPTEEFKERLDVPAYERKKIKLQNVPHSAERNISKFNLNEENQILGNNKFLHDNVD